MVRVYEVGNESNYVECPGLVMADEFLPLVSFNNSQFLEDNTDFDEPTSVDGIELADLLTHIPSEDNKVYTITNCEDELVLPFTVKNGTGESFMDEDGVVEVSLSEETEGITFNQELFETGFGKEFKLTISKTDPLLEKEVELLFLAKDNDAALDNKGELKDVLCGRLKILIGKKKVKYEELKIKVLDCRSNDIIPNARVKKIVLNGAENITSNFNLDLNKNLGKADSSNLVKQSQQALEGLGFDTKGPGTNYGDNGRTAYNAYWESRFPKMVKDKVIEKVSEGNPPDEMLRFIIEEYNSNFSTNDDGFINLKTPKYLLDKATTIQIGLKDYPILLEARTNDANTVIARKTDVTGNGTGFDITWGDGTGGTVNQSIDWGGNFGWQMRHDNMNSEFKVSLEIPLKEKDDKFKAFDKELMSKFYEDENSAYHLIFYAMQWCQPVWDGIADNANGEVGAITEDSYIQHAAYHGMNMHIVTTHFDLSGSDENGGKGYGKSEYLPQGGTLWRGETGHRGIDLHAVLNSNLYALHSGKVKFKDTGSNVGKKASLSWKGNHNGYIDYCHLNDGKSIPHVLAGQIIGKAGRTGNLGAISKWPGHVHLNIQATGYEIGLRNSLTQKGVDDWNINCIPNNDYTLLLPCSCDVTAAASPNNCNFSDTDFVHLSLGKPCWAVQELCCPHMSSASAQSRAIQAQLLFLFKNDSQNYLNPGLIDGDLGQAPQNENDSIGSTRLAINKYKETHNISNNDLSDYEVDDEFIQNINEESPITQP